MTLVTYLIDGEQFEWYIYIGIFTTYFADFIDLQ